MTAAWRILHLGCPCLASPIMAGSKLFPPKSETRPPTKLPRCRTAAFSDREQVDKQPPSMGKAARVATSGLLTSTLGYPARGPASWRRRSESSIITDSAVVGFTDTLHDSCAVQYSRPWLRSKNRNRNSRTVVTPVYVAASEGRPVRSRERRP